MTMMYKMKNFNKGKIKIKDIIIIIIISQKNRIIRKITDKMKKEIEVIREVVRIIA